MEIAGLKTLAILEMVEENPLIGKQCDYDFQCKDYHDKCQSTLAEAQARIAELEMALELFAKSKSKGD